VQVGGQEGQWGRTLSFPAATVVEEVQWVRKVVFGVPSSAIKVKIPSYASDLQMQRDTR
jgi:hypothetical protein